MILQSAAQILALWALVGSLFVDVSAMADGAAETLRPGIGVESELLRPGDPVRIRFSLVNDSAEAVSLGSAAAETEAAAATGAVTLPLEMVFGSPRSPAISIQSERGVPQVVLPPAFEEKSGAPFSLAPNGIVGIELDLRKYATEVRYPGKYTITWRPFGREGKSARVTLRIEDKKDALIVTDYGKLQVSLDYEHAPLNVDNFLELVRNKFYDGLIFHRVVPGFAASGGCPVGDGSGMRQDGKKVPAEFADLPMDVGTVAMARRPDDPDSASCQFFVALGRYPDLDRRYSIIGFARDAASLQTLRAMNDIATDRQYRPLQPLFIRSINLIDRDPRSADVDLAAPVELPPSNMPRPEFPQIADRDYGYSTPDAERRTPYQQRSLPPGASRRSAEMPRARQNDLPQQALRVEEPPSMTPVDPVPNNETMRAPQMERPQTLPPRPVPQSQPEKIGTMTPLPTRSSSNRVETRTAPVAPKPAQKPMQEMTPVRSGVKG